jgi:hypothetical protein
LEQTQVLTEADIRPQAIRKVLMTVTAQNLAEYKMLKSRFLYHAAEKKHTLLFKVVNCWKSSAAF